MRNSLVLLIGLLVFVGCSKSFKEVVPEDNNWWNGYLVDTTGLNIIYYEFIDNDLRIAGIKSGKLWVSIFNQDDKKQVFGFVDDEEFESQRIFDKGYGNLETVNLEISRINIHDVSLYKAILIWYAKSNAGDLIIINGEKIIYKKLCDNNVAYSAAEPWFENYILVYSNLHNMNQIYTCVSSDGKELFDADRNTIEYRYLTPVSIEEGIYENDDFGFNGEYWRNHYYRQNIKTGQKIWDYEVAYNDIQENAKINVESKKMAGIWSYTLNITNYDGTKEARSFKINIETGEVIKL